jgi:hypothetical protein
MQELIIFFLIAFVIVGSLLWKTTYSYDNVNGDSDSDSESPSHRHGHAEMPHDYAHNSLRYNSKYHERQPTYLDPHFGSASGGNKVNQYVI